MSISCVSGEARCSGSARMRADAPWSAFGSESGTGKGDLAESVVFAEDGHGRGSRESRSRPEMILTY
jgi:hypothetical protein